MSDDEEGLPHNANLEADEIDEQDDDDSGPDGFRAC